MFQTTAWPGATFAIVSALLFGASTPLAKLLLGDGANPQLLAGLFYFGSGIGLAVLQLVRLLAPRAAFEAPLRRPDLPRFALAVLLGGALAPTLLLQGLARTSASTAALLLNLEGVATMAIAWLVFRENVDRRLLTGAAAIVAGAVLLSWTGGAVIPGVGPLLIAGACAAWAIDNNLTRTLAGADPVQIAMIKGLAAGSVNLAWAFAAGSRLPSGGILISAMVVGFFGYGISLVLFVRALRYLGAARTSAYFSTAPFIGALLAVIIFSESVSVRLIMAGLLMAIGVYVHLRESHEHEHSHPPLEHEHSHVHDAHHLHLHDPEATEEPHSHWHQHAPLVHKHPHYPDLHHRHEH
jgi:drug/metabolite transporter (DMT)-like permease